MDPKKNKEIKKLVKKLKKSINKFLIKDKYLIEKNASERAITHMLAVCIMKNFKKYDVDCEYNLNIPHTENIKKIELFEEEVKKYKPKHKVKKDKYVSVFPDIIVHKRKKENQNKIIIEVKKDTSSISDDYDIFKLKKYTSLEEGDNILAYTLGVAIKISTSNIKYSLRYFSEGKELNEESGKFSIISE